jgi:hypothetical protein
MKETIIRFRRDEQIVSERERKANGIKNFIIELAIGRWRRVITHRIYLNTHSQIIDREMLRVKGVIANQLSIDSKSRGSGSTYYCLHNVSNKTKSERFE